MIDTVCWPSQFQPQGKWYLKATPQDSVNCNWCQPPFLKASAALGGQTNDWHYDCSVYLKGGFMSMDQYYEWYQIEINNIMIMLYMMIRHHWEIYIFRSHSPLLPALVNLGKGPIATKGFPQALGTSYCSVAKRTGLSAENHGGNNSGRWFFNQKLPQIEPSLLKNWRLEVYFPFRMVTVQGRTVNL